MMKANEIRVGNWIKDPRPFNQDTKKFFKMTDNGYFKATARDIQYAEEFDPIPLTEEILLKCGFEKKNCFSPTFHIEVLQTDFYLRNCFAGGYYWGFKMYEGSIESELVDAQPIEYLHQLQNLIFSLMGKELEINL